MFSSTLRQFRHTFTIVALEFVNSLAQIAAQATEANSSTNRQHEAEKKKSSRNEGRIGALDQKLKDGEKKREAIETVIKDIFNSMLNFGELWSGSALLIGVICLAPLSIGIATLMLGFTLIVLASLVHGFRLRQTSSSMDPTLDTLAGISRKQHHRPILRL